MSVEGWLLAIEHNLMFGASITMQCVRNNKCAIHEVHVNAACNTPSHTIYNVLLPTQQSEQKYTKSTTPLILVFTFNGKSLFNLIILYKT